MKVQKLSLVIFDFDGVLVDSEDATRRTFADAYTSVTGRFPAPTEAFLELMGRSLPDITQAMRLPPWFPETYREKWYGNVDRIVLYPGIPNLLAWLDGQSVIKTILTGKDTARTLLVAERLGIERYFAAIMGSETVRPKPHPEGVAKLLQQFGIGPDEAILIGDSVADIQCARNAGVASIGVGWGVKPERLLTVAKPDRYVATMAELRAVLEPQVFALTQR